MESQVILQIKHATLKLIPEISSSLIEFNGLVNHENYKLVMERAYDLIIENELTHWVLDLTNMKVILPENQRWTNEYYLAKLLKTTKINKVAIIVGNDIFTHASMNKIRDEISKAKLPIRYFDNFEDIKTWFLGVATVNK